MPIDLQAFAALWADRWLKYGGGLIVHSNCDKLQMSMDLDGRRWRSRHPTAYQKHWHDGWTVGRWRELQELAREIPGLREALIDHVMAKGAPSHDGGAYMVAPHPWTDHAAV